MLVTPIKPNVIADSPHFIEEYKPLSSLQTPVYAEKQQLVKVSVASTKTAPVASGAVSGDCNSWMAQAGISDSDAVWLITKESNCRPTAQNPRSTAYGIFQFLDSTWAGVGCVKTSDPVQQMICGQRYVMNRYGSWSKARAFHSANGWY